MNTVESNEILMGKDVKVSRYVNQGRAIHFLQLEFEQELSHEGWTVTKKWVKRMADTDPLYSSLALYAVVKPSNG